MTTGVDRTRQAVSRLFGTLVRRCVDAPRVVVGAVLGLALAAAAYVGANIDVRTDLEALMSPSLPWRQHTAALEREFPSEGDDIVLVIDAQSRAAADAAAAGLAARLAARKDLFVDAVRLNGGPFFDKEGLLYLPLEDVRAITERLIASQPLLGPLTADPSLRGLTAAIETGVRAGADDPSAAQRLGSALAPIADLLEARQKENFSWDKLLSPRTEEATDWRQFITLRPRLDYSRTMPAAAHTAFIRRAVATLGLPSSDHLRVRITGSAPLADDELATLRDSFGPVAIAMFLAMIAILLAAVRSPKFVFAILTTVLASAAMTAAAGLLLFQQFNLISLAFLPLVVGLGIDFCIQFAVRARSELAGGALPHDALAATGAGAGVGLALAGVAATAGFLAFSPTDYRGLSELGVIAAIGMVLALVLTLTFLPALLIVLGAGSGAAEDNKGFRRLSDLVSARRWSILGGIGALIVMGGVALTALQVDFDPMSLRNRRLESMSTYIELSRAAETTPETLSIVRPSLTGATRLAARLRALPGVGGAITLADLVPGDQARKLALIGDARDLLSFTLDPLDTRAPPTDEETVASLKAAARSLRTALANPESPSVFLRVAEDFERLAKAPPGDRAAVQGRLFAGFDVALGRLRALLDAEPVHLDSLPADLRAQWISASGRARIEVTPNGLISSPDDRRRFVSAVQRVAPDVAGDAVTVVASGATILKAFGFAGALSGAAILLILLAVFRSLYWSMLAIAPILVAGLMTFATCALTGVPLNLENMIALPLLLAIGVAFNIYFIAAYAGGVTRPLRTPLAQGVLFSALTTGASFAALTLSDHPGTASLGQLLLIALGWILVSTLVALPALFHASHRFARPSGTAHP